MPSALWPLQGFFHCQAVKTSQAKATEAGRPWCYGLIVPLRLISGQDLLVSASTSFVCRVAALRLFQKILLLLR